MSLEFDLLDFEEISGLDVLDNLANSNKESSSCDKAKFKPQYDKTTTETYRIKRLYKIDPLTDQEIPENLIFEYKYRWDPFTGNPIEIDEVGPLCFNALTLYDYYFTNRFKGLWNPPADQYQGYYGDLVGTGKNLEIKSRGDNPEKYLFRLPIIDCYLPLKHNYSIITMGPLLTDEDIALIDSIVSKYHRNKNYCTSLKTIKEYYDNAICSQSEISNNPSASSWFKSNNYKTNKKQKENLEKFNRINIDKLVQMKN